MEQIKNQTVALFKKKIFILLWVASVGLRNASAQYAEIGFSTGMSGYMGDINRHQYLPFRHAVFGVLYKQNLDDRHVVKLGLSYASISADDALSQNPWQQQRNLRFFSPIAEIAVHWEFNFFKYDPFHEGGGRFTPYLSLGAAAFYFDPQAAYQGRNYHLRALRTERSKKYSPISLAIPIGLGVKVAISRRMSLFAELIYRPTFTDYLDDISGKYRAQNDGWSDAVSPFLADRRSEKGYLAALPGSERGQSQQKDRYVFAVIGISFSFAKDKCPTVK